MIDQNPKTIAVDFAQPDLTACDIEPIHIPGSIQPYGLMLVAVRSDLSVIGGAGELEGRLAGGWLGASLGDLLGESAAAAIRDCCGGAVSLGVVPGIAESFSATGHVDAASVLVELEPAPAAPILAVDVLRALDAASVSFERAAGLQDLCDRAAASFRQLTGFDRVMVYRFLDDEAGVVVSEDRDPSLSTFMNHHFPATDIPKQARALYVRNRVRVIPDAEYTPAVLRPASAELAALDLSAVNLRSVSPIHLQYLKNMGVRASASVSIVKDGVLWGLIACHHQSPRELPLATRLACDALAGGLARQIRAKEEAQALRDRIAMRSAEDAALSHLRGGGALWSFLEEHGGLLRRMMEADSFAAVSGQDLIVHGEAPDRMDLRELAAWVSARALGSPFHSASLGEVYPPAAAFADKASGLLSVTLSAQEPLQLLWFRAEKIETVKWAGDPHKAATLAPGEMLTPRASFDAWTQTVVGKARPWTLIQLESASRLARSLLEYRQLNRIRDLNRDLTATVADKDSLLAQKDYLIKEVNHRVQNSLQLVSAFLTMQARASGDEAVAAHLEEAQRRLSAVSLVHRRLYVDDRIETIDLSRYLSDLCADLVASLGPEWADMFQVDFSPVLISTDRAVHVGLILTELVINANKYAYGGRPGPVAIGLEQVRDRFRLIVADSGGGRQGSRAGFGSRMLQAMVGSLGGSLDETGNDPGLRVILTAPLNG